MASSSAHSGRSLRLISSSVASREATGRVGPGLVVGTVTREASPTVPRNRVLSQDPDADSLVDQGTEVDYVVSDGKPKHHPLDTAKIEVVWNRTRSIVKKTSAMDPDLAAFYQTFEDGSVVLVHDFVSF